MELLFGGFFASFFVIVLVFAFVPIGIWIWALVEAMRAPEPAFGPPWDNTKNAWILGMVIGLFIPAGAIVTTVLWWVQGHKPLRAGAAVQRPFWAPGPRYYPPPPPAWQQGQPGWQPGPGQQPGPPYPGPPQGPQGPQPPQPPYGG